MLWCWLFPQFFFRLIAEGCFNENLGHQSHYTEIMVGRGRLAMVQHNQTLCIRPGFGLRLTAETWFLGKDEQPTFAAFKSACGGNIELFRYTIGWAHFLGGWCTGYTGTFLGLLNAVFTDLQLHFWKKSKTSGIHSKWTLIGSFLCSHRYPYFCLFSFLKILKY